MSTPLTVTRIGHACQLIEIGETRILTGPWFTQTATYYQGEPVTSTAAGLGPSTLRRLAARPGAGHHPGPVRPR